MRIIDYPDRDLLAIDVANKLAGELKNALLRNDRASLAVPGGTTPGPIFDALCAADLDWSRVHVFPTDERWVPQDDPRSNAGLIARRLLTSRAAAARFLPLYAPADDPEDVLPELTAELVPELPISVLLLGMGADGHVASLFPGAPELAAGLAPDAPILVAQTPPSQPERRVSLSARVLADAMSKHLLITGQDKRARLDQALTEAPEDAPVAAVLDGMTVHWAP